MAKLSILIPSRQEKFLNQTIRDCFTKAQGEIEVVVCLDGYWPTDWKEMTDAYPNLHTVHHGEAKGMRAGINACAASAISRGAKWLMKADAHVMLDEGFDVKLLETIEPNWIVVPRRKRLDAENWQLQDVGKPDIDYHYLSFPDDPADFGGKGLNGKVWEERIRERLNKPEYEIDDEMSSQGSLWLTSAAYFQELELMDEASYGPFWNEMQEIGLKAWLSGGALKINKRTWYAHLHKGKNYEGTTGQKGRGYKLPESWLQQGRNHTLNWIYNEAWPKQSLPFSWLIEHFWPVPTWPDNWEEILYATRRPRTLVGTSSGAGDSNGQLPTTDNAGSNTGSTLNIRRARYGVLAADGLLEEGAINVTERVRSLVRGNSLDIIVNNSTLTPNENPFRGVRKTLQVTYSFDSGKGIRVQRAEKDWLIIGHQQVRDGVLKYEDEQVPVPDSVWGRSKIESVDIGSEGMARLVSRRDGREDDIRPVGSVRTLGAQAIPGASEGKVRLPNPPTTPAALNDYLVRKFQISPQRLRGPMPIELRDFHRNDLAQLFAELGFKRGAEIGVAEGHYSEILLKANPELRLLMIDPWHHYSDNPQGKSKEKHEFAYNEAKRRIQGYKNALLVEEYSMVAASRIKETLDFVYVDGNHLFDYVMQDLIEWSKKVRSGGIVSGDDYYALDQKRWIGGGVVEAVQAYTNAHRIPLWFIFEGHKSTDFMWVRP